MSSPKDFLTQANSEIQRLNGLDQAAYEQIKNMSLGELLEGIPEDKKPMAETVIRFIQQSSSLEICKATFTLRFLTKR